MVVLFWYTQNDVCVLEKSKKLSGKVSEGFFHIFFFPQTGKQLPGSYVLLLQMVGLSEQNLRIACWKTFV